MMKSVYYYNIYIFILCCRFQKLPLIIKSDKPQEKEVSYVELLRDHHILIIFLYQFITLANMSFIEPQISNWIHTFDESVTQRCVLLIYINLFIHFNSSQIGFLYLPTFTVHILSIGLVISFLSYKPGNEWAVMHVSMLCLAATCLLFACMRSYGMVIN
jgi:hypothetical protein